MGTPLGIVIGMVMGGTTILIGVVIIIRAVRELVSELRS